MPLKAYAVMEKVNGDASKLVFAKTANEAKTLAFKDDMFDSVEYTDLRVTRAKFADPYGNATEQELLVICLRNGWWTSTRCATYISSENVDEAISKGWI